MPALTNVHPILNAPIPLREADFSRMLSREPLFGAINRHDCDTFAGDRFTGKSFTWVIRDRAGRDEAKVWVNLTATGYAFAAHFEVLIGAPSPTTVQRINTLFSGFASIKHYHRVNGPAVRLEYRGRGSYEPLRGLYSAFRAAGGDPVGVPWNHGTPAEPWRGPDTRSVTSHGLHIYVPSAVGAPAPAAPAPAAPAPKPAPAVPFVPAPPIPAPAVPAPAVSAPVAPAPKPAPAPVAAVIPGTRMADPLGLFRFPAPGSTASVVLDPEVSRNLDLLWRMHANGSRQTLALVGPTGTGKTSLVYDLAARNGVGVFTFDAAGAREFGDWVGSTHLRDGRTEFLPSGFLQAIDADGPYAGKPRIVLIDEVNRAESSGALNALIPVLHGFGSLYVPEMGRSIAVDPTVMVAMTANRGSAYAGTVSMDLALADRVTAWVRLNGLDAAAEVTLLQSRTGVSEEQATLLHRVAVQVRLAAERGEVIDGGGVSTRRLLSAAEKVAAGFTLYDAACITWLDSYSDEGGSSSERAVVLAAIDATLRGR